MAEFEFVRGAEQGLEGAIIMNFELIAASGVYDLTETDLDNQDVAGVLESTGTTPQVGKGADGDPIVGLLLNISEGGKFGTFIVRGPAPECRYSTAGSDDPDVGDRVVSKGTGKVKQSVENATTPAGGRDVGVGHVYYKDSTATTVKLIL